MALLFVVLLLLGAAPGLLLRYSSEGLADVLHVEPMNTEKQTIIPSEGAFGEDLVEFQISRDRETPRNIWYIRVSDPASGGSTYMDLASSRHYQLEICAED